MLEFGPLLCEIRMKVAWLAMRRREREMKIEERERRDEADEEDGVRGQDFEFLSGGWGPKRRKRK